MAAGIAMSTVLPGPALAQRDRFVTEIKDMAEDRVPENGFCRRVPWPVADSRAQDTFLNRARVDSDEGAKFSNGACSYTLVTQVSDGRFGKCVRYRWWACEPGKTCDSGMTRWCIARDGSWRTEN